MLSAKEYINKIIEFRKAGRHDLIEQMARDRSRMNRHIKLHKQPPLIEPQTPSLSSPRIEQPVLVEIGEASGDNRGPR